MQEGLTGVPDQSSRPQKILSICDWAVSGKKGLKGIKKKNIIPKGGSSQQATNKSIGGGSRINVQGSLNRIREGEEAFGIEVSKQR